MDWQSCDRCKNESKDGNKHPCIDCGIEAKYYEPKTNTDRIRNMTDEELAEFLKNFVWCKICEYGKKPSCGEMSGCTKEMRDKFLEEWLQAEVKEGAE